MTSAFKGEKQKLGVSLRWDYKVTAHIVNKVEQNLYGGIMNVFLGIIIILLTIILSPAILVAGFFLLGGLILFIFFIVCLIIDAIDAISDFIDELKKR